MIRPIDTYRPDMPKITAKPTDAQRLKEQTDAYEAIILKMMLDHAIKSESTLLPKDPGREIYQSMMNDTRSKQLSGAFGYSDLLFHYLQERQKG